MGLAHLEGGDATTAQSLFARALDIFEARFKQCHPLTAMVLTNMATSMAVLGQDANANDCILNAEATVNNVGGTVCLELELRAAAVRFAVGDESQPSPVDRWRKAEAKLLQKLGTNGLDAVCARCKEGL